MANNTYKDIQDRTMDILSKSDATTRTRVKEWINMGYKDFVARELWPFRETVGTLTTIAGTQEYSLVDNFADMDASNILTVSVQGAQRAKLQYVPFNQLKIHKPDLDADNAGIPTVYYLRAGNIGFWPQPSDSLTIEIDYYSLSTDLEDDEDEPIIPVNYREALMHYALSLEHDYNTDGDLAQKSMNRYEQIVLLARNNLLAQPADYGGFTVLGPADFKNHTGLSGEVR